MKKIIEIINLVKEKNGSLAAMKISQKLQHQLQKKKLRIGIYDHAFHFAGGGQRYAAMIAAFLQHDHKVTFICNKAVNKQQIKTWYNIDLGNCKLKILPVPIFDKQKFIYPAIINRHNHFSEISADSINYDVFINANMHPYIKPLSTISLFIAHFPDQERNRFFEVDNYDYHISNSKFGAYWLEKKWHIKSSLVLYPGVDMKAPQKTKENMILSVARFEEGGSKKQLQMIEAFQKLCQSNPKLTTDWQLIILGGSAGNNTYEKKCRQLAKKTGLPIKIICNAGAEEIKKYYQKATIFWHLCGLNETSPHCQEHFGMTTVEAMQNRVIPIVYNGGGQREIISDNGYLIDSQEELIKKTLKIIRKPDLAGQLQKQTQKSAKFSSQNFQKNFQTFFKKILKEQNIK